MSPARKRLFEFRQDDATSATPPTTLTLQAFFEALPRPLPEPVDDKTVAKFKAPGSLNRLIQSACGGKFDHKLIWTTDVLRVGVEGAERVVRVCTNDYLAVCSISFPLFALLFQTSLRPMYRSSNIPLD